MNTNSTIQKHPPLHLPVPLCALFAATLLALPAVLSASLQAAVPDLTEAGAIAKVDRKQTYNLGPTGMRGWIYHAWSVTGEQDATTAFAPYQILVTDVASNTPAVGILAINDVILGASTGDGAVPLFTGDARKSLGWAIGAAEAGNGILKLKRWRPIDGAQGGDSTDVSITLPVMGAYSDTAPYDCPKTARILANAASSLHKKIVKSGWGGDDGAGAISALALLATGNPDYLPMLQAYARTLAPKDLALEGPGIDAWKCYNGIFLAEYYMLTKDTEVFHGLSEYVIYAATHTSMFGTAGHGFSTVAPPGGWEAGGTHGSISWYGPVNQAGLAAQLTIVLGKKAGVVHPEINPGIARAANFFGYYVNRGSIPYGEHQPYYGEHQLQGHPRMYYDHCSNGKDGLAAIMFSCMGNKPVQAEYFSRMALAGFKGEQYGHTGQGFSYLWTTLGANMGGPKAVAEYLKQVRWDRDMRRRCDGSFVYEGGEQWAPGFAKDYWDDSPQYWGNATAYYLLHAAIPLKKLYITGKSVTTATELSPQAVSNAIWAAKFTSLCGGYSREQLVDALGAWDPIVRYNAATELSMRTADVPDLIPMLITMAENPTNANQREAACTALGCMKATNAVPALVRRLSDPDIWVRAKAAKALGHVSAAGTTAVPDMLGAFVRNVAPTYPYETGFNWSDPLQIANGYLAETLFKQFGSDIINADKTLLYPAIRAGIKHPAGMWRETLSGFVREHLSLSDVVALAPDLFTDARTEGPCDRMFTSGPVGAAMSALSKHRIYEGIDICLDNVTYWGQLGKSALENLPGYGEAARRTLPILYDYLAAWPPGEYSAPVIIRTIAAIEAATNAPALVNVMPVASPQILATPVNTARAVTLAGASCRTDTLTYRIVTKPAHGTLKGTPPNVTYSPAKKYQGMDSFTFTVADSLITSTPGTVHMVVGSGGTGLTGCYYDKPDLTSLKATQVDPSVNFDWSAGAGSVCWTGQVLAPESGTYRFSTRTSDGVRLWVNGVKLIDDWNDQATNLWNDSAEFVLKAGEKYSLKMEYYHHAGPATARLYWYMPSRKDCSIIPQELLTPVSDASQATPAKGLITSFAAAEGNTLPVRTGLVCWFDPAYGIYKDADQQVMIWHDRSGNGHHAVHKEHNLPTLVQDKVLSKPVLRFTGDCRTLISGKCFIKEQYLVVRSPSSTWTADGSFLGRASGRASSYMLHGNGSTGFGVDQLPASVSMNGTPVAKNQSGNVGYSLGTITNYMVLKITVNDSDTNATQYLLSGTDGDHWLCKFDAAEILGYSRALTASEEAAVGSYLSAKYGIKTDYPGQ